MKIRNTVGMSACIVRGGFISPSWYNLKDYRNINF